MNWRHAILALVLFGCGGGTDILVLESGSRLNPAPPPAATPAPTDCDEEETVVSSNVASDTTWRCRVVLDGTIFVEEGSTLTIEPGTVVSGRRFPSNPPPTALVVSPVLSSQTNSPPMTGMRQ